MAAKNDPAGLNRMSREKNNYLQGRSGSKVPVKGGVVGSVKHNSTKGGGINRSPRGAM